MPPKKKGSVKKKKKKTLVDVAPPPRPLYGPVGGVDCIERRMLSELTTRNDLVFVRLKQSDWAYSDFTVMVHASAPLYTLCRKIEEKHGRMASDAAGHTSLQLFRHPPNEKNILPPSDWHLRLDQVGMTGGTVEEQHQAIIYYNYVPATYSPLLQKEPQLILPSLSAEENEEKGMLNDADFMRDMDVRASSAATAQSPIASSSSGGNGAALLAANSSHLSRTISIAQTTS